MSLNSVKNYFKQYNMDTHIVEFPVSSATVELAAQAIGCKEQEIAKTMSFHVGDEVIVIVMAGDARIDNKKYKSFFHKKAKMLHGDEVESLTGHPVGGVCPLGFKEDDIERICFLIAHHHTYTDVDGIDYRILLEADFLVNAFEDNASIESIQHAKESFFETETGKHILDTMFKS